MSRLLGRVYLGAAALAAVFFVGIEVLILYQLGGQFLPYIPRSADEFAGYCMAASAFLALAYTFNANEHIRVTLVVDRAGPRARRVLDRTAVTLGAGLGGFVAWYFVKLAWQSWQLDERSSGLIALPMWLPQAAMALGAVAFFLALAQRAARVWGGGGIDLPVDHPEAHRADR